MTAATFHSATAFPEVRKESRPGLLARLLDAMIEARKRQAGRELAMYRHLVPEDLVKKNGYGATLNNDGALPFTR